MKPQIRIADDAQSAADMVAELIRARIAEKPSAILGLATGGTPVPVYQRLCEGYSEGKISFAKSTTFNLDEYVGLSGDHPQSYRAYMRHHLFDHVDIPTDRTYLPEGDASNTTEAADRYEELITRAGGIDFQLLGIGTNGHIGFNEPGSPLDSRTRLVDLAESTIESNSRYFRDPSEVPRQAITMGIGTILQARQIVLMATGSSKARVVADSIHGRIDIQNPASCLQQHDHVVYVLDREASSLVKLNS